MMGNDVERILSGIDAVKDTASKSIDSLSNITAYKITTPEHTDEKEVPQAAASFVEPIVSCMNAMNSDCGKMDSLKSNMYTSASSFNNSYGSPWEELTCLQNAVKSASNFANAHSVLKYVGEKAALLGLINKVLSTAIDARWALMHFHDYVQRGFDCEYNGKNPSVTFVGGDGKPTTGNLTHKYDENVRIPEQPLEVF